MINSNKSTNQTQRIAALLAAADINGLRAELVTLLEQPGAIVALRALDQAGLLTQIIPELEPARTTDQPNVHFLPVLAHSFETVCAVEWLLDELQIARPSTTDDRRPTNNPQSRIHNLQSTIYNLQFQWPFKLTPICATGACTPQSYGCTLPSRLAASRARRCSSWPRCCTISPSRPPSSPSRAAASASMSI